jgi:hypothetical protein
MVIVNSSDAVPAAFVALTVTLETPTTVGVPEIWPFDVFTTRPGGRPVAAKLVGLLAAVIWYKKDCPTNPDADAALEISGDPELIVILTGSVPVAGAALVALTMALKTPTVVGVPEMSPVVVLTVRPGGRPVALKLEGLLVARI